MVLDGGIQAWSKAGHSSILQRAARWAKLPMGSGTTESAIRRVVNWRLKGTRICCTDEHAEPMLLLRTYYKSKRWNVLENEAFAAPLAAAA